MIEKQNEIILETAERDIEESDSDGDSICESELFEDSDSDEDAISVFLSCTTKRMPCINHKLNNNLKCAVKNPLDCSS